MAAHITIPIVFITAHDDLSTESGLSVVAPRSISASPFDEHSLIGAIGKAFGRARSS